MGFGFGFGFNTQRASAAPAVGFDPASLPWAAGAVRHWWHKTDSAGLSVNTDGTGGMVALDDPVGAILSANGAGGSDHYRQPYSSGGNIVRKAEGLKIPASTVLMYSTPDPFSTSLGYVTIYPKTTGLTMGFSIVSSYATGINAGCYVGGDSSPQYYAMGFTGSGSEIYFAADSGQVLNYTIPDLTVESHIIGTITPISGTQVTMTIYINGASVASATKTANNGFSRDLLYTSSSYNTYVGSRFLGEGDFTANIADIYEWQQNGSGI